MQKQIVLNAERSSFVQKQTLLETQRKVIETQYALLNSYVDNPEKDTTTLEQLLSDTRTVLADVQKMAEQGDKQRYFKEVNNYVKNRFAICYS
jgi:hypothetical protein